MSERMSYSQDIISLVFCVICEDKISVGVLEQRRNKLSLRQNKFTLHRINHKDSCSGPSYHISALKSLKPRRRWLGVPALQLRDTSSPTTESLLPVLCQQDKNTGLIIPETRFAMNYSHSSPGL